MYSRNAWGQERLENKHSKPCITRTAGTAKPHINESTDNLNGVLLLLDITTPYVSKLYFKKKHWVHSNCCISAVISVYAFLAFPGFEPMTLALLTLYGLSYTQCLKVQYKSLRVRKVGNVHSKPSITRTAGTAKLHINELTDNLNAALLLLDINAQ